MAAPSLTLASSSSLSLFCSSSAASGLLCPSLTTRFVVRESWSVRPVLLLWRTACCVVRCRYSHATPATWKNRLAET